MKTEMERDSKTEEEILEELDFEIPCGQIWRNARGEIDKEVCLEPAKFIVHMKCVKCGLEKTSLRCEIHSVPRTPNGTVVDGYNCVKGPNACGGMRTCLVISREPL